TEKVLVHLGAIAKKVAPTQIPIVSLTWGHKGTGPACAIQDTWKRLTSAALPKIYDVAAWTDSWRTPKVAVSERGERLESSRLAASLWMEAGILPSRGFAVDGGWNPLISRLRCGWRLESSHLAASLWMEAGILSSRGFAVDGGWNPLISRLRCGWRLESSHLAASLWMEAGILSSRGFAVDGGWNPLISRLR
ncbi:unnamed protein product, partial [Darwinula stevensoni]